VGHLGQCRDTCVPLAMTEVPLSIQLQNSSMILSFGCVCFYFAIEYLFIIWLASKNYIMHALNINFMYIKENLTSDSVYYCPSLKLN